MDHSPESNGETQRIHFMDVARAALMLLGIPFHAALIFGSTSWVVTSSVHSAALEILPAILGTFRMPAFFLIAGFFAALLLERRSPARWLRLRLVRLGIPLLAGLILIVPAQDMILAFEPWGVTRLPRTMGGIFLSHLWFLPILIILSAALAAVWPWLKRVPFADFPAWLLGLIIGVWSIGFRGLASLAGFDLAPFDRLFEIDTLLDFAPYFCLGLVLRRNAHAFARFQRWHWPTALIGLLALGVSISGDGRASDLEFAVSLVSNSLAAVCISQSLLAIFAKFADKPIPVVERLVDASFSIYLFHHPIIIVLSLMVLRTGFGPVASWVIICVATLLISYAMHQAMRRSAVLLFLFNGIVPPNAPHPSSGPSRSPRREERPA